MATQWRSEQDRDRAGAPRSRPFQPLAPHRAPPQFKHPLVERRGSSPSGLRLVRAEARGWVWPPAGSATCVGVKSTPSEQSVASPRGSGVSARRAAWATLPSSLTVAQSPRGAVLALPFVKWRVCVSLRGQSPLTATHTHSLSAAVRAADKTPRPPAASRGRGPAPGARGWRSSLLRASFLFTSLELGPAQRQRRHCTRGAGEPAPMPLWSRPSLEVHLGDGLERGSGEDREQLASPAQPLHPNLRQEEPDPSQYDLFFPLSGLLGIHRPFFFPHSAFLLCD